MRKIRGILLKDVPLKLAGARRECGNETVQGIPPGKETTQVGGFIRAIPSGTLRSSKFFSIRAPTKDIEW